jgi:hypothetical protein
MNGLMHRSKKNRYSMPEAAVTAASDHLVGSGEQIHRHRQADRFGGFEIDRQFKHGRLFHGQVGGLRAAEHLGEHSRHLTIDLGLKRAVGNESASLLIA